MDELRVELTKFKNDLLKQQLGKFSVAGEKAMKEIRSSIASEWFGEFSSTSMNSATVYTHYTTLYQNNRARIIIHSWVNINAYNPKPKAASWVSRHGGEIEPKEYVLMLQLDQGIIGLPEKASDDRDSDWVNPRPHVQEPLYNVIINDVRWSQFSNIVDRYVK